MCTRNVVESMKGEHEGNQGDGKCAGQGDANPVDTLGEQGAYAYCRRVDHIMGEAHRGCSSGGGHLWIPVQRGGSTSVVQRGGSVH